MRVKNHSFALLLALWALLPLLALAPLHPAHAADQKAEIESITRQFLDNIKAGQQKQGRTMILDGPIMVEQEGAYYAVTLPYITVTGTDGVRAAIGILSLNVTPGPRAGLWKMTMALPTPIFFYDGDGAVVARLEAGSQYFAGLWHTKLANFINVKAGYGDVSFTAADGSYKTHIGKITLASDMKDSGGDVWSGPFRTALQDVAIDTAGAQVKIATIENSLTIDQFSVDDFRRSRARLDELSGEGQGHLSLATGLGLYDYVAGVIGETANGGEVALAVKDAQISVKTAPEEVPAVNLNMPAARLSLAAHGFKENQDDVTLHVTLAQETGEGTTIPDGFAPLLPTSLNFDVTVDHLPYQKLVALGRAEMQDSMTGAPAAAQVPQILAVAKTQLRVVKSYLANKNYRLDLDSQLAAQDGARYPARGTLTAAITNMDHLIAALGDTVAATPGAVAVKPFLPFLTMLKMVGQQNETVDGQPVRTYNVELKEDGQIFLNGTDLNAVFQMTGQ